MDNENKTNLQLRKEKIMYFFSKIKARREYKKKVKADILASNLPIGSELGYEDFTPKCEIENGEEYINALHWAFKNKDVRNIALTGPYGSGKSSIIQSYIRRHPGLKALHISLATFNMQIDEMTSFEKEVELGILKQLFYKVNANMIPESRYRKIRRRLYRNYVIGISIVSGLLGMFLSFFFPRKMAAIVNSVCENGNLYGFNKIESVLISIFFVVVGVLVLAYVVKWIVTNFRVKEVNVADKATVASEREESESIFNKNIDEIIYFFEATEYDTVFIEDLDRFDNTEIFVKLRELNTILNNYDLIKRRIAFVYAIRDDMFIDTERTKFFDFIIPVIPIINSTNSGEILKGKLKIKRIEDGGLKSELYDISAGFITMIAPFIEDMRILTSICNEFIVYKKTLRDRQNLHLNDEKMFAIMVFKNLYPSDFVDLEAEKGIVKKAFEDKRRYVECKRDSLKKDNRSLKNILENIEIDVLNDLNEIKAALLYFLTKGEGPVRYVETTEGNKYYPDIFKEEFNVNSLRKKKLRVSYFYSNNGNYRDIIIDDIEKELKDAGNYFERYDYIKNNTSMRKEEIRLQIEKNEKKMVELQKYSLKKIIEEFYVSNVLSDEVKANKFLVFLLRNGYIDENYADYINYFHPNSITRDEMNFIIGIRTYESVGDWAYELKNLEQIIERIEAHEFGQKEILNYSLVDFLITNSCNTEKYNILMEQISNRTQNSIAFIKTYIERGINEKEFINKLSKIYHELWVDLTDENNISEEAKYRYLTSILSYADIEDIKEIDLFIGDEYLFLGEGSISSFVVKRKECLKKLSPVPVSKMQEIIEKLSINFEDLDVEGVNSEILDFIFENMFYDINSNMIEKIFEVKYPNRVEDLRRSNYTTICEVAYEPLMEYIDMNFEMYIKQVVLVIDTNIYESISSVEYMLERMYANNIGLCLSILDKEKVVWDDLSECCVANAENKEGDSAIKRIWNQVIEQRKTLVKWKNFCVYYARYGLTSCLLSWLDEEIDEFLQDESTDMITDEIVKNIITEDISIQTFEKLITKFKIEDFSNELSKFDFDKVSVMVRMEYLPFSIKIFEEMKDIAPKCRIEYLLNNKDEFFKEIESTTLSNEELIELFKSSMLTETEKKKLFIILSVDDMNYEMAMVIRTLEFLVDKEIVNAAWNLLSISERYQILLNQLEVYELDELADKFGELEPMYQPLSKRTKHKVTLPIDEYNYNNRLVLKLKEIDYVTSADEEIYEEEDLSTKEKVMKKRIIAWVKQK